jgi:hypothetical protein
MSQGAVTRIDTVVSQPLQFTSTAFVQEQLNTAAPCTHLNPFGKKHEQLKWHVRLFITQVGPGRPAVCAQLCQAAAAGAAEQQTAAAGAGEQCRSA